MRAVAAPQSSMSLCVGMHRVPVEPIVAPDEATGEMKTYQMVRVSQRGECAAWLWSSLGAPAKGWSTSPKGDAAHPAIALKNVPLFNEVASALERKRHKRKANQWLDSEGRVLPAVVPVCVRGKVLLAANNTKSLILHLGDSTQTMDWFLGQIWEDLGTIEATNNDREREDPPCNSVPGLREHVAKLVKTLNEHELVQWASWDPRLGRFRVGCCNKVFKTRSVPKWKQTMLKLETLNAIDLKSSITQTFDGLIGELGGAAKDPAEASADNAPEIPTDKKGDAPESPTKEEAAAGA